MEIIGLIPAAGKAERLAPLPCSKELYPIGFRTVDGGRSQRPKVVSHYLLEKMRMAGIRKACMIIREGKWDIPAYFGDGKIVDMRLAYLMMDLPFGVPYTINQAYPFVHHAIIAFGFPDILFEPDNAFEKLIDRQSATRADLVLGLLPASEPSRVDMVDIDQNAAVRAIQIKPEETDLIYTWVIALWTPLFSDLIHNHLSEIETAKKAMGIDTRLPKVSELTMGEVIQVAIEEGMRIDGVVLPGGEPLDIGTPENLAKAQRIKMS
jgi:glucose-1-phosphate thymidylyltransferase